MSKKGLVPVMTLGFCPESRGPWLSPLFPGVILFSLGVCEALGSPRLSPETRQVLRKEPSSDSIKRHGRFEVGMEGSGLCWENDSSGLAEAGSPETAAELAQRGEGLLSRETGGLSAVCRLQARRKIEVLRPC